MRILILLLSLLAWPLTGWSSESKEAADESKGPVIEYVEMKPKFTVNLAEPKKYLLINVQLLVEGAVNVEKVKKHMPLLRHELIMAFSGMPSAELQTMEQREALRLKTKQIVFDALSKRENPDGFRDVFFSEFLVN